MSALQRIETDDAPLPAVNEATAIIQMIERAASNPAVDIDKMERLLLMQERVIERRARQDYAVAMAEMQPKLPVVDRKGLITIREKGGTKVIQSTPYALWEDTNKAILPVLAEHGFALTFRVAKSDARVEVTGILSHRGGHAEETMLSLPMDDSGSKNNVQAIGSSVSYGKRYTAGALLNLTSRGEDDDGKAGGAPETIDQTTADELRDFVTSSGANLPRFLRHFGIERLEDMPLARHGEALTMLRAKAAGR